MLSKTISGSSTIGNRTENDIINSKDPCPYRNFVPDVADGRHERRPAGVTLQRRNAHGVKLELGTVADCLHVLHLARMRRRKLWLELWHRQQPVRRETMKPTITSISDQPLTIFVNVVQPIIWGQHVFYRLPTAGQQEVGFLFFLSSCRNSISITAGCTL